MIVVEIAHHSLELIFNDFTSARPHVIPLRIGNFLRRIFPKKQNDPALI